MKLGDKGRDKITGFQGTITGRVEYISGCNQVLVQPSVDKEGKHIDGRWIDEDRIEITPAEPFKHEVKTPGPCDPAPVR